MTMSVDVLAVLETQAALLDWLTKEEIAGDPLRRVRAAVAELIEAAQRLHDRAEFESFWRDASAEVEAVGAALARVKGA